MAKTDHNPFRIDIHRLDIECRNQAELMYDYGRQLADAKYRLEELSQEYMVTKAELDQKIRDKPERYKLHKITETGVQAAMRSCQEYQDAKESQAKAQHAVDILFAAVTALAHKKDMLSNLIALHRMEYYSDPAVSQEDAADIKRDVARNKGGVRKEK